MRYAHLIGVRIVVCHAKLKTYEGVGAVVVVEELHSSRLAGALADRVEQILWRRRMIIGRLARLAGVFKIYVLGFLRVSSLQT
jgi:hypothetical protein